MRTYNEILESMRNKYRQLAHIEPEQAADIGLRLQVLAGEIFSLQNEMQWLRNQMFPTTASGEYLDLHAASRGLTRKEGQKAEGSIIFWTSDADGSISIPSGTVCSVTGSNPTKFITTEDVVLPVGRTYIQAHAEAVSVGTSGNVRSNTIVNMVTAVAGITKITSSDFSGGVDPETDEQLRARIIDSFQNISNGTNKAYYIKTAMEVSGVTAAGVIPRNRGAGTVDVFITNASGNPSASLLQEVKDRLDEQREINVDIQVNALTLVPKNISFEYNCRQGYNIYSVNADCEAAVREYFSTLAAGESFYISDMGEYIKRVEGVKNYTVNTWYFSNLSVSEDRLIVPGEINITGVQE